MLQAPVKLIQLNESIRVWYITTGNTTPIWTTATVSIDIPIIHNWTGKFATGSDGIRFDMVVLRGPGAVGDQKFKTTSTFQNETTRHEIEDLVRRCEWKTLEKRLLNRLTFGTAGLRGVMCAGFYAMNDLVVIQSAQGLLKYILQCYPNDVDRNGGIVLGYDGRYNSKRLVGMDGFPSVILPLFNFRFLTHRFAELTACVFLNAGVPVLLFSQMVATPFIPFTILEKKCLAGVHFPLR